MSQGQYRGATQVLTNHEVLFTMKDYLRWCGPNLPHSPILVGLGIALYLHQCDFIAIRSLKYSWDGTYFLGWCCPTLQSSSWACSSGPSPLTISHIRNVTTYTQGQFPYRLLTHQNSNENVDFIWWHLHEVTQMLKLLIISVTQHMRQSWVSDIIMYVTLNTLNNGIAHTHANIYVNALEHLV